MSAPPAITNALTIDVEDWFQVSALAPYVRRADWDSRECRVEANCERILARLDAAGVQATFFTLGWIAERYPALVRRIVDSGHELASHGYGHERASELAREAFREDVRRAKGLLEDLGGVPVRGYRAPSFSIGTGNLWAFDELAAAGHVYSSSVYPIAHDHYGMPHSPRFAYRVGAGGGGGAGHGLLEVPCTTLRLFGRNLPSSGGGYFRLLPYALSRWTIREVNRRDAEPAVFYFHPWEIDPGQPRVAGVDAKTRFRHYVNLERMEAKLVQLFADFRWDRMDRVFLDRAGDASPAPRGARPREALAA
jgi:polysaccharide deacetylase family protein (PEP-CTERM system associated)